MSRRKVLGIAGVIVICLGIGGILWAMIGDKEISMAEAEIQARINEKMPFEKKGVKVSDVRLDLSHDRINLDFEATTRKLGKEIKMHVATIGNMRYDEKTGAFYFEPEEVKISHIRVNGVDIKNAVSSFVNKIGANKVAEKLGSKKVIEKGAELAEKVDQATQTAIQEAAADALQRNPVYKLQGNFKGHLIHAALKKVEVRDHKVIAHVSIWHLTLAMLGYVVLILLGIALLILICACPGLPDALFGS